MSDEIIEIEGLEDDAQGEELPGDFAFTVNGEPYEVAYNKARVNMYERASKKPLMTSIHIDGGGFSYEHFKMLVGYGIRRMNGGYVEIQKGLEMAEKLIEANGYGTVYQHAIGALSRDCGFLFR